MCRRARRSAPVCAPPSAWIIRVILSEASPEGRAEPKNLALSCKLSNEAHGRFGRFVVAVQVYHDLIIQVVGWDLIGVNHGMRQAGIFTEPAIDAK